MTPPITQLDIPAMELCIGQHRDIIETVTKGRNSIANEVEVSRAENKGVMIDGVQNAHDTWDADMAAILKDLDEMVTLLTDAKNKIAAQDAG